MSRRFMPRSMHSCFHQSSRDWEPLCKLRWLRDCLAFRQSAEPNGREFAGMMLRLINDEGLRKNLSSAGRCEVEQRFSAGRMVENTIRVYEDVLQKNRRAEQFKFSTK